MLVRTTRPVRLECVVRGYLFGGGWQEYRERGTVGGFTVPTGLQQAEQLPEAALHADDEGRGRTRPSAHAKPQPSNSLAPSSTGACVRSRSRLYDFGARHAADCGVILADTKFEFGELDDRVLLIDEMMTPDSSRYWPVDDYRRRSSPPSFDKQYVRDYMDATGWDHEPPAPRLSPEAITNTRARYREAYELITGASFDDWFAPED